MRATRAEQRQPLIIAKNNMKKSKQTTKKTASAPSSLGNTPKQDAGNPTSARKEHPSPKTGSNSAANPEIDDTANHVEHHIIRDWEYEETRLIRIGTMWWINGRNFARISQLLPGSKYFSAPFLITSLANSELPFAAEVEGNEDYVRLDSAMRFMGKAGSKDWSKRPSKVYNRLAHQECNSILGYNLPELKATVSATTAHKILEPRMEFGPWLCKIADMIPNSDLEDRLIEMATGALKGDFRILVPEIVEVASGYDSFAGLMTYVLLTDGGFFHGGGLGESADASLERFVDMVPDQSETVDCRKLHEFIETTLPFGEWFMELLSSKTDGIHCSAVRTDEGLDLKVSIDVSVAFSMINDERLKFASTN
jgi:hypothetical protein